MLYTYVAIYQLCIINHKVFLNDDKMLSMYIGISSYVFVFVIALQDTSLYCIISLDLHSEVNTVTIYYTAYRI